MSNPNVQVQNNDGPGDGLDNESKNELQKLFKSFSSEEYKDALGILLSTGLKSNTFDYPQGVWPPKTPARHYITTYLSQNLSVIRGSVVEFAPAVYRNYVNNPSITQYDVWNVSAEHEATIIGDIHDTSFLPANRFDTILLLHVLSALKEPKAAVEQLYRVLSPGGTILCTVPVILQKYAPDPQDYWRFTRDSLNSVFESFKIQKLFSFGNAATVAGSPHYIMDYHFDKETLDFHDEWCPSILALTAVK